jgi:hypothetical protein
MGSGLEMTHFFNSKQALMENVPFQDLNFPSEKSR